MYRIVFTVSILMILAMGCQGPENISGAGRADLKVTWSSSQSRTLLPSSYPATVTYSVTLQPNEGSAVSQNGIAGTDCTFTGLPPNVYQILVKGFDSSGNLLDEGTASVDTTGSASSTANVVLAYITAGVGTGGISVTLDLSSAGAGSTTATLKLVDPSGNVTSPALSSRGANYQYVNASAAVGAWQAVFTVKAASKTALKLEEIIVAQNVTTSGIESFMSSDFGDNYAAVTGLSLSKASASNIYYGMTDQLTATIAPSAASNKAVAWSSSDASVATVSSSGLVTIQKPGPAAVTITATSVDNPGATKSCAYSVPAPLTVTYNTSGSTAGSVPIDLQAYYPGQFATILGNSGGLGLSNFEFTMWNTQSNGSGSNYLPGSSLYMSASANLYPKFRLALAQWAQNVAGTIEYDNRFSSVARDASDNLYAVGYMSGIGTASFGNGVSVSGNIFGHVGIVVKYNALGQAQWCRVIPGYSGGVELKDVAVDSNGRVIVVGTIGNGVSDLGNGISVTGGDSVRGFVFALDSAGTTLWGSSITTPFGNGYSVFSGVCADTSGYVYVAGFTNGSSAFAFGGGLSLTGPSSGQAAFVAKYDSSGAPQWMTPAMISGGTAAYNGICFDSTGAIIAVGSLNGTFTYAFGNSVTATPSSSSMSPVVVKYSTSGLAQWAQTSTSGSGNYNKYNRVAADGSGNIFAAGMIVGQTVTYGFGNNVTAKGSSLYDNPVLVKYDTSGNAQWASTMASGSTSNVATMVNEYSGVAVDGSGNCYVSGYITGNTAYGFGNSVTATGAAASLNPIVVKYNSSGAAQWAQTSVGTSTTTGFFGLVLDGSANLYAVGQNFGAVSFSNSVSLGNASAQMPAIVMYNHY